MSDEILKPPGRRFVIELDDAPSWKPTLRDMWTVNRLTNKSFQPYVSAIGQASLAWNDLQENIANLFSAIAGIETGDDSGMILAIWHSQDSDRAQRKMLTAANNRVFAFNKINDKMHKDIKWLLAEADKLSDARNDVIHSPLLFLTNAEDKSNKTSVGSLFHPRARKLSQKEILPEIRRCRDRAIALRSFCRVMQIGVIYRDEPWPDRPKSPNRARKNQLAVRPQKTLPIPRARRPRSSPV